jgi:hypothetical protein
MPSIACDRLDARLKLVAATERPLHAALEAPLVHKQLWDYRNLHEMRVKLIGRLDRGFGQVCYKYFPLTILAHR